MYRSKLLYSPEEYSNFINYIIKREYDLTINDFCNPLLDDYPLIAIIEVCHEYGTVDEEFVSHKDFKEVIS